MHIDDDPLEVFIFESCYTFLSQDLGSEDIVHIEMDDTATTPDGRCKAKLVQTKAGSTTLAYWGKLVEPEIAKFLPRQRIVPLHVTGPSGKITFFIDGQQYMNKARSDCCFTWFVQPAPLQKDATIAKAKAKGKAKFGSKFGGVKAKGKSKCVFTKIPKKETEIEPTHEIAEEDKVIKVSMGTTMYSFQRHITGVFSH